MHNNSNILKQFLNEWPLQKLKKMTIEEYTNLEKTSFCYWLEAKTNDLGSIWGGSSYKFGIYKRQGTKTDRRNGYSSDGDYAWVSKYGNHRETAFKTVKELIVKIAECADKGEFKKVDAIDIGDAYKWKIAFLYSNEKLLPIYKKEALEIGAESLELSRNLSMGELQLQLMAKKDINESIYDYSNRLWDMYSVDNEIEKNDNPASKDKHIKKNIKYWMYAPGEQAKMWDEYYEKGIMGLGWTNLGDIRNYNSKDDIVKKLQELENTTSSKKNDATANYDFANNISKGDIVIAKKGRKEYLGYGIVLSDYDYDDTQEHYKSFRKVQWIKKGIWNEEKAGIVLKTLTDITPYPDYIKKLKRLIGIDYSEDMNYSHLNSILYGPPGTGKTYNTINKALELCGVDLEELSRTEIKQLFEQKVDEGRIVFTTFHQSMTYEDFVEGIKPIEPEKEGDPVIYRVEEGIFRKLCIEASFSLAKEDESVATENVLDFSLAFDNFVQEIEEKLASEEQIELTTKNGGKVVVDGISQQGNIIIKHPGKDNTYPVSKQRLSKLHTAFPELSSVNNIDLQFRSIIGGSNSTANWSVLNAIRNNNSLPSEVKKSIRTYTWDEKKEVVQSLKKQDYKGKKGEPYVLIIDEINRGNVSQIFGELITLIEEDKRLGNAEAIQVQLPYSKEWFGVPPNVHIIGTMNTADRSVEALDTALRRRFSFTEMPPVSGLLEPKNMILSLWNSDDFIDVGWDDEAYRKKADDLYKFLGITDNFEKKTKGDEIEDRFWAKEHLTVLANEEFSGFNLQTILDTLNRRIEKLLDKDHMIGHSYFLTVNNIDGLKAAFQNNIIPLLQEYFFGDYGKIGLVIGSDFFDFVDNQVEDDFFAPFEDYDISPLVERKVYHLKNVLNMDDEEFTNAINNLLGRKK